MSAGLIVLASLLAWLFTGAWFVRPVFNAIRPHRVPACGERHADWQGNRGKHVAKCYRRQRPDLTRWKIDNDIEALWAAATMSLAWPAVISYYLLSHSPPETAPEKEARLRQMKKKIEQMEEGAAVSATPEEEDNG